MPIMDPMERKNPRRRAVPSGRPLLSTRRTGVCWDNAVAESFFATIERELIDTRPWPTGASLQQAVFEYIEGCLNLGRLESSLNYDLVGSPPLRHPPSSGGMVNTANPSVE
jgi:transposase InsO family protein